MGKTEHAPRSAVFSASRPQAAGEGHEAENTAGHEVAPSSPALSVSRPLVASSKSGDRGARNTAKRRSTHYKV